MTFAPLGFPQGQLATPAQDGVPLTRAGDLDPTPLALLSAMATAIASLLGLWPAS